MFIKESSPSATSSEKSLGKQKEFCIHDAKFYSARLMVEFISTPLNSRNWPIARRTQRNAKSDENGLDAN